MIILSSQIQPFILLFAAKLRPTRKSLLSGRELKAIESEKAGKEKKRNRRKKKRFLKGNAFSSLNSCGGWKAKIPTNVVVATIEGDNEVTSDETVSSNKSKKWKRKWKRRGTDTDDCEIKEDRAATFSEVSSRSYSFVGSYLESQCSSIAPPSVVFDEVSAFLNERHNGELVDFSHSLTELSSLGEDQFNDILQFEQRSQKHCSVFSVSSFSNKRDENSLRTGEDDEGDNISVPYEKEDLFWTDERDEDEKSSWMDENEDSFWEDVRDDDEIVSGSG